MANTGNVGGYFRSMGKPHTGHLAERGIRLFGGNCHYPGAYPAFLGAGMKRRRLCFCSNLLSSKANQLINCRHVSLDPNFNKIDPLKQACAAAFSAKANNTEKKKKGQPPSYLILRVK